MPEIDSPEKTSSPEWDEVLGKIKEGVDMMLIVGDHLSEPVGFDPFNYSEGTDVRVFAELSDQERQQLLGEVFSLLKINPQDIVVEDTYIVEPDENYGWSGTAQVEVITTGRSSENIYLHRRTSEDGVIDYFIASKDYRPDFN